MPGHRHPDTDARVGLAAGRSHLPIMAAWYGLALALTTLFATACWYWMARSTQIPSHADILASFGLIRESVDLDIKPEPVENRVFLLTTLLGAALFAWAGWKSSRTPGRLQSLAVAGMAPLVLMLIWVANVDWSSIVPPAPSAVFSVAARQPLAFFGLMLCYLGAATFIGRYSEKWLRWLQVGLIGSCLICLARMVLINNNEGYAATGHYEVFVYPLIQDWLGLGIHLQQKSQYGMYPIFLRPMWFLTGGPSTPAVTATMAALLLLSNAAMVAFTYRFTANRTLGATVALLGIVFSLLLYPFWPGDAYFAFFPIRLVFPSLAMAFIVFGGSRCHRPAAVWAVLGFGLFWNFESGVVALAMFGIFTVASRAERDLFDWARLAVAQLLQCLAGIVLAGVCVLAYYLQRFGQAPGLDGALTMIRAFSSGFGAEPMPLHGAWVIHVLTYAAAITVGVRQLLRHQPGAARDQGAALLAVAAMGLLWLRYYQGRSLPLQLIFASFPAFFCFAILADIVLARFARHGAGIAVSVIVGAPLFAALALWAASNPVPQRALSSFLPDGADAQLNIVADRVVDEFRRHSLSASDRLLAVAPYTHLVQLKLGQPSPVNTAGMCQLTFESEIDDIVRAIGDPAVKLVVFDGADTCPMKGVRSHPRVVAAINAFLEPLARGTGCSAASFSQQDMYIRKRGGADAGRPTHPEVDLALNKAATQSTTMQMPAAMAAVDGNTDGNMAKGSTTHSAMDKDPWWQVDLGASHNLGAVEVWNRTDCCSERLKNYWVFTSEKPFEPAQSLSELKSRPDIVKRFNPGVPCPLATATLGGEPARYVRVQIEGTAYLSLAEVRVLPPLKIAQ